MRQILLPLMGFILFCSCNNDAVRNAGASDSTPNNTALTKIDTVQAMNDITALVNAVHNGLQVKDFSLIEKSMTADAMMIGTDPEEVWSFSQFKDYMKGFLADTTNHGLQYETPAHKIMVHGNSALIVDQYQLNEISKKMMTRNIAHARYENGKWLLDLFSWNLVPKNEDISKIDKAL